MMNNYANVARLPWFMIIICIIESMRCLLILNEKFFTFRLSGKSREPHVHGTRCIVIILSKVLNLQHLIMTETTVIFLQMEIEFLQMIKVEQNN